MRNRLCSVLRGPVEEGIDQRSCHRRLCRLPRSGRVARDEVIDQLDQRIHGHLRFIYHGHLQAEFPADSWQRRQRLPPDGFQWDF